MPELLEGAESRGPESDHRVVMEKEWTAWDICDGEVGGVSGGWHMNGWDLICGQVSTWMGGASGSHDEMGWASDV